MSESSRPRAMIVDDDPVLRKVAGRALSGLGFECLECTSGEEALERAHRWEPSLVLLDVEMPGLDGFATCIRLREHFGDRLAILIATGHAGRATIDAAFEAGGSDFIEKPFDWALLQHRVRFLMRAHAAFNDLTENERRLAQAQRIAKVGHWEWRPETGDVICSEEARRLFGLPRVGQIGFETLIEAMPADDREEIRAGYLSVSQGQSFTLDHRAGDRSSVVVRQQAMPLTNSRNEIVAVAGTIQDITERERAAEQIRNLSYYDGLTGLPNELMLHEHIEELIEHAAESQSEFAVLRISVDRFDTLTSTIGPHRRDEIILELAARLELRVTSGERLGQPREKIPAAALARLGRDQFAIVLDRGDAAEAAKRLAGQVLDIMRTPFLVDGSSFAMTVSIGIAVYPVDGEEMFQLFHAAELSLHDAQQTCMGSYRMANPTLQKGNDRRVQVELALNSALERGELFTYYQPQWHGRSGEIGGAELLARWTSPTLGSISPGEFVPVAEDTGLIVQLSEWTIETACRQLRLWRDAGIDPIRLSLNVSPRYLEATDGVAMVHRTIDRYGVDPTLLEFEFTETAMIDSHETVHEFASALRNLGVKTALDDFGTGYSSLQHLVSLPLDTLKIDLSFVQRLETDHAARTICSSLLAMSQELGLEVVAEGVETEAQMLFLRERGCEWMQGYLVSPAVEVSECVRIRDERMAKD